MPATFSQIYIQVVFAVKGRENLIDKKLGYGIKQVYSRNN